VSDLNTISKISNQIATKNGLLEDYPTLLELKRATADKLGEEIGEFRNSSPSDTFSKDSEQSEIADIILILTTYCRAAGYDVEKIVLDKLQFNATRPYRHGK